jgi:hypothetical protein
MVISGGMLFRNRIQQWRYFARVRYRRQTDCLANIRVTVGWLGQIYILLLYFFFSNNTSKSLYFLKSNFLPHRTLYHIQAFHTTDVLLYTGLAESLPRKLNFKT